MGHYRIVHIRLGSLVLQDTVHDMVYLILEGVMGYIATGRDVRGDQGKVGLSGKEGFGEEFVIQDRASGTEELYR